MPTCITLSKVSKCYGATVAVSGLSLEVEQGEVLGLLGPNGAGKSTTLCMLAGLVRPSSGAITIFGKDLHRNYAEIAARFGVLVERPDFYDYLTVRRNLKLYARLAQRHVNVDRAMALAGILEHARVRVGNLSSGLRQRLGLAQAVLTEPELLLLDEPTTGLDVEATEEILQLLRRLAERAGVTIVFSTHMLHEVERLCDRVAILNEGNLVACERTSALISYDQNHVEVLLDGVEGAARRLRDQPWVEKVEPKTGRLVVHLREGNIHQLNAFLVNAGYQVSGLIPRRRTLRDYFLRLFNQPGEGSEE